MTTPLVGRVREILDAVDTLRNSTGSTFYVHSGTGNNSNGGLQASDPLATIAAALAKCTASKGDVILVMPGHAESVAAAAGINVDKIGVSIIGLGVGENRPIITFTTATTATLAIAAANARLSNLVFKNDIDSQAIVIDVNAAGCVIEKCELLEGSSKQFLIGIDIGEDRCTVRDCYIKSVAAGADSGIKISAAKDRIAILNNEIFGDFSDACIHNPTGNVATRLRIEGNVLTNLQSGDHAIELVSACTGVINRNIVNSTLAAVGTRGAIDPGSCYCIENYGSDGVGDVSGVLNPAADA
ncbi:MAG: hypothetical protein IT428_19855 [Planctomycetaceae bacterium]|nr:hypothetical protein [Planctomycetaceae bacterium]